MLNYQKEYFSPEKTSTKAVPFLTKNQDFFEWGIRQVGAISEAKMLRKPVCFRSALETILFLARFFGQLYSLLEW